MQSEETEKLSFSEMFGAKFLAFQDNVVSGGGVST